MKIPDVPSEILQSIFIHLSQYSLVECAKVCKSWHRPAQQQLFMDIEISKNSQLSGLLDYLGYNALYREKIKQITFDSVYINILEDSNEIRLRLDQELCTSIAESCPKIEYIVFNQEYDPCLDTDEDVLENNVKCYYMLLYKLRQSLKRIKVYNRMQDYLDDPPTFFDNFPQLSSVDFSDNTALRCLASCLYLFEKQIALEELRCSLWTDIKGDFIKQYIETKPADSQKRIITKLSQLKVLHLRIHRNYYTNSLEYISQYFTGLEELSVIGSWADQLTSVQQAILFGTFLDFACALPKHHLKVSCLSVKDLSTYLPAIAQKVYYQTPNSSGTVHRMFQITIQEEDRFRKEAPFDIISKSISTSTKSTRILHIDYTYLFRDAISINTQFLEIDIPLYDVKIFKFVVNNKNVKAPIRSCKILEDILNRLPSLEKLIIEELDDIHEGDFSETYPRVTSLEYKQNYIASTKLVSLISAFPNLKYLKLTNFGGQAVSQQGSFAHYIHLENSHLERLFIDLEPLTQKTYMNQDCSLRLTVEVTSKGEKRFFKIFHAYLGIVQIDQSEYESISEDQVIIKIKDLEHLNLYKRKALPPEYIDDFIHGDTTELIYDDYIESKISFIY